MKELIKRFNDPTPMFWKKVQKIGIALGAIGGVVLATPALPAGIIVVGGYLATVGAVTATLSQFTSTK
jgi:predicted MFS family arabinose efflux permease